MSDQQTVTKFFVALNRSPTFDTSFLESIVQTETLTEKQRIALDNTVKKLKIVEKMAKYDLTKYDVYFSDEIDWDDMEQDMVLSYVSNESLKDKDVIYAHEHQRFMSVAEFKKVKPLPTVVKPKLKMKDIVKNWTTN